MKKQVSKSRQPPLPTKFRSLKPFLDWAQPTAVARTEKRHASTPEQIVAFYNGILPKLDEMLEYLDQYPMSEIPAEALPLSYMALAMAELALYVEWFDGGLSPVGGACESRLKMLAEPGLVYDAPRTGNT